MLMLLFSRLFLQESYRLFAIVAVFLFVESSLDFLERQDRLLIH